MNLLPNPSGFCGALSAFSGTIGDIADVQFGCATEDSMLDVPEKRTTKAGKASQHLGMQDAQCHVWFELGVVIHGYVLMCCMLKGIMAGARLKGTVKGRPL